jgi:hypothetical protein
VCSSDIVYNDTDNLTSGSSSVAEYITQIRDMGKTVKGTVRSTAILSIDNPSIAYAAFYETIINDGVSDESIYDYVLVDSAFGGVGHVLGFNNVLAAPVSYNSYHKTLTSGGPLGNVYAIRNPAGDFANANSYALIAGTINANAIALGEVYDAEGILQKNWDVSSAIYSQNFNVAAQDGAPNSIFFKPDGTKMYIIGTTDSVLEYNLSTAWDVSTVSYVQNFSVAAQDTFSFGVHFSPDGTKMYTSGD